MKMFFKKNPHCSICLLITTYLNYFLIPHVQEDSGCCVSKCTCVLCTVYESPGKYNYECIKGN